MKPKRPDVGEIGWHDAYWAYRYYAEDMDKWLRDEVVPVLREWACAYPDCDDPTCLSARAILKEIEGTEQQCDANGGAG